MVVERVVIGRDVERWERNEKDRVGVGNLALLKGSRELNVGSEVLN